MLVLSFHFNLLGAIDPYYFITVPVTLSKVQTTNIPQPPASKIVFVCLVLVSLFICFTQALYQSDFLFLYKHLRKQIKSKKKPYRFTEV